MPFFVLAFIVIVAVVSISAKKKAAMTANERDARIKKQLAEMENSEEGAGRTSGPTPAQQAEARARQEELKRRLQENARRREAERAAAQSREGQPATARTTVQPPAKAQERRPLEKRTMESTLKKERPIAAHTDDDCGGGSIHDGYHEGVTKFNEKSGVSVAGNLGHRLADEDERLEREAIAAENAKKVLNRISKLPPLAQGMIYSEILGKPRSETA